MSTETQFKQEKTHPYMLPTHLIMGIYGYSTHHPKTTPGRNKALLQQGIMNQHDPVTRPFSLGYGGVPLACHRIIYHLTGQVATEYSK